MKKLSHLNNAGEAHMVDISNKEITARYALAESRIECSAAVINALKEGVPKGDVFSMVRIAGIQAAKRCADLIPLCHPLPLTKVSIDISQVELEIVIRAMCKTNGKTGIEMEALTAASIAALTFYDMCKAIDKSMVISATRLLEKSGGKSGDFHAKQ